VTNEELLALCKCQECPLKDSDKVFGEGPNKCQVILVGMAPADEELRQKRPFVGMSGKLLRQVVDKLGYKDYGVTNTLLCPIPDDLGPGDQRKAVECCSERLFAEVKEKEPELLVCLGNMPIRALTGVDYSVMSVEGRVLPGLVAPVLPVVHPAALLTRTPENFPDFVDALQSGQRWLNGTYQQGANPAYTVVDEFNFANALQMIDNAHTIAVDIETTRNGFYPYGRVPDTTRCISIAIDERTAFIVPGYSSPNFPQHTNYVRDDRLKRVLEKCKCVFHHGQFDCAFLACEDYNLSIHFDTMIAHYMLDERQSTHGLKRLAGRLLGVADWEDNIKTFLPHKSSTYDLVPDQELYKYAAHDAIYTYHLYKILKDQMPPLYNTLILPVINMFTQLRHEGIDIDVDVLMNLDTVLGQELNKNLEALAQMVGRHINPNSSQEVAQVLFNDLKLRDFKNGSTDKEVLEAYKDNPIVQMIIDCRGARKLLSTYVDGAADFVDMNFRIHPMMKMFGTVTGRLSSEDPSIMNIPRESQIKRMFIPAPGHSILELDQKQHELRSYCLLFNDPHLKKLLLDGGDPHRTVAVAAFGEENAAKMRVKAKNVVFGRLYGGQGGAISAATGLSSREAQNVIKIVDSMFPEIKNYAAKIMEEIKTYGYLESYFGRKRHFGLLTRGNKEKVLKQGTNFPIQSTASDINLFGMLYLYNNRTRLGIKPLFPVHDSILIDIEDSKMVAQIAKEVNDHVWELVDGKMKFEVEAKVGPNWREVQKVKL